MNADAAMYHAKGGGKNGYSFFDASMNSNARKQLQLLQDLRNALEHRQFSLYYQPKFDAASGRRSGPRRCCAGSIRRRACCCRTSSSIWRKRPG
jgi:predicted signal transduction protein with EAL and GGDEF domain